MAGGNRRAATSGQLSTARLLSSLAAFDGERFLDGGAVTVFVDDDFTLGVESAGSSQRGRVGGVRRPRWAAELSDPPTTIVSMNQHKTNRDQLKFRLKYAPLPDTHHATETLWGRWLDKSDRLVLTCNNAREVPLVVNDVVRVNRVGGVWDAVEVVRLTESVATWTTFDPPIPTNEALATYDRWVADGHAVFTEGDHVLMVTAWRELMSLPEILGVLAPDFGKRGWKLWAAFTPEQRLAEILHRVELAAQPAAPVG